jgi:ABC-type polysaccharide/polyol phosphate transport system ATPase subunit
MLKILSGVLKPTHGRIHVNGSLSALIEIGAGFHPELTGRQNIYLNGTILGMKRSEIARKFDQIVDFSGLEEFLDTPVKRYSTGMYARLGFSVAAHVDPEVLIVDEVLSVGDYVFQNKCMSRMKEIVNGGAAVVFVSHNLNAVANLCTRALLLDHGRVRLEASTQEVISAYLTQSRSAASDWASKEAYVAKVVIRDRHSPRMRFEAGEDAWIDVDVKANRPCKDLSLSLYLRDDKDYNVFNTSTERLRLPTFSLELGETIRFTFRLKLHLARGAFHIGTTVYRYSIQKNYDEQYPIGTIFITSESDARGVANLYPEAFRSDPLTGAESQPPAECTPCTLDVLGEGVSLFTAST